MMCRPGPGFVGESAPGGGPLRERVPREQSSAGTRHRRVRGPRVLLEHPRELARVRAHHRIRRDVVLRSVRRVAVWSSRNGSSHRCVLDLAVGQLCRARLCRERRSYAVRVSAFQVYGLVVVLELRTTCP
jgi:hypothetical protein